MTAERTDPSDPVGTRGAASTPDPTALVILVNRARSGDRIAFERLVERHVDSAYRVARAILGNEADARDATQEAFLDAWRRRASLRDPSRFDAWLGRILVNSCREYLRGRRRRAVREITVGDLGDPMEAVAAPDPPPDDRTAALDTLERAFDRLGGPERTILVLHHLEHRPLDQIAASLDVPVGTVKSRLHAARRKLERALEAEVR